MDTRNKRASAIGFALAALVILPAPDTVIDAPDRQQVAYSYAGISSAPPIPIPTSLRFAHAHLGSVAEFADVHVGDACRFVNAKVGA